MSHLCAKYLFSMKGKNIFYILTCISFCIIIGAGVYEHFAVWPIAFSEPPKSLTMFQGDYAMQPATFWKLIHPLTLILFIITLALNWRTGRRKSILTALGIYFLMLVATFIYFVPQLMQLIGTHYSETVDTSLQKSGSLWITLSLVRAVFMVISAFILISGLTINDKQKENI